MSLTSGTRLGPYEIISPLGVGGMGEVWRARDRNLGREVAIKVLPAAFTLDPDRRARFAREARLLASLNHPHIGAIYGVEDAGDVRGLVLELVEGPTLADRLKAGPLPLAEVLAIARQIADALDAAHERGIIHRDLKPANIKIAPDGVVKVLDFGLAKAVADDVSGSDLAGAPTATTWGTREGLILGTAAYMSPEQARGRQLDKRTDNWAFGCVLYEMLTGHPAFSGETTSDLIAAILERDPDWRRLSATTPSSIQPLVKRCLQKDLRLRLRDIGDARIEMEEALTGTTIPAEPASAETRRGHRQRLLQTVAMLAAVGILGVLLGETLKTEPSAPVRPAAHFVVLLAPTERLAALDYPAVVISPDGSRVVYVATRGASKAQLFVRAMNSLEAAPIPGTADAISPFFSPDSSWIAFFAQGKLKKVPAVGGTPVVVCDAPNGFGGHWGGNDSIVFAASVGSGVSQVPAAGGKPTVVTAIDTQKGEFSHRWPELLPDGETVLFTVGTLGSWDDAQIVAQSLRSGQRHLLIQGGTNPHYLSTGHLIYARQGALMVVPFDAAKLTLKGAPVRVLEGVLESFDGAAQASLSRSGSVVYVPSSPESAERRLVGVDRSGAITPFAAPPRAYFSPRVSPDGRKLLVTVAGATQDIWVYDIAQGTLDQLTFDVDNASPVWTPDGQRATFSSSRDGIAKLFWIRIDGSGTAERLASSDFRQLPGSWTSDGRFLAFVEQHPATGRDIWMLPYASDGKARPFLDSPFDESAPRFSPDRRWLAYVSNESGQSEVYVTAFGDPSRKRQVSTGGSEPVWAPDGRELFYRAGDQMLVAPVLVGADFRGGQPRVLFAGRFEKGTLDTANYDVLPDGLHFVMVKASERESAQEIHVLLDWVGAFVSKASPS